MRTSNEQKKIPEKKNKEEKKAQKQKLKVYT